MIEFIYIIMMGIIGSYLSHNIGDIKHQYKSVLTATLTLTRVTELSVYVHVRSYSLYIIFAFVQRVLLYHNGWLSFFVFIIQFIKFMTYTTRY